VEDHLTTICWYVLSFGWRIPDVFPGCWPPSPPEFMMGQPRPIVRHLAKGREAVVSFLGLRTAFDG